MTTALVMPTEPELVPRGISRYEYRRARGWLVRVERTEGGERKTTRRLFSDNRHGGRSGALAAAVAFWQVEKTRARQLRIKRRSYGYVRLEPAYYETAGGEVRRTESFCARYWNEAGQKSTLRRSCERYGFEGARRLCLDWLAERQRGASGVMASTADLG